MNALGRGLASLIPKRDSENAEDVLENIDSMEEVDEEYASPEDVDVTEEQEESVMAQEHEQPSDEIAQASQDSEESVDVDVVGDFEELDDGEELAPPEKPNVTPLTIDPEGNVTDDPSAEDATDRVDVSTDDTGEEEVVSVRNGSISRVPARDAEQVQKNAVRESEDKGEESIDAVQQPAEEQVYAQEEAEEMEATDTQADFDIEEDAAVPGFGESNVQVWDQHEDKVEHIPLGDIRINPLQPRRSFDEVELDELKDSIERHGILQPLVVRRLADGQGYELIAGERRLRATKLLKWERVPCVVRRDVKSDQSRLVYALIENIQRENLNPIEEAMGYQQLSEEYGLTHEEIGHRVGKSRVGITNAVRVLQLPAEIQRGMTEGKISMGHAKAILMIPDEEKQIRFYRHLLDEGLTVRKAETRARRIQRTMKVSDPLRKKRGTRHPLARKYAPPLEERYGHDVAVKYLEDKNRFEVTFKAYNETEIEELVGQLMGTRELPDSNRDSDVFGTEE